jgi:hypothetical protein
MGRKKKSEKNKKDVEVSDDSPVFSYLKEETVQGIIALLFFVVGIFFVLSAFEKAGIVGVNIYEFFSYLFGFGYWLVPILLFILSVSFFNSLKKHLALTHTVGGILFFISSLSLLNIFTKRGGILGNVVSNPLVSLFDVYASIIILFVFVIISFLVMFDIPLKIHFRNLFGKKEDLDLLENYEDKDIILLV